MNTRSSPARSWGRDAASILWSGSGIASRLLKKWKHISVGVSAGKARGILDNRLLRSLGSSFVLLHFASQAAVVPAASCSAVDVQAAIDQASDGDTVQLPACANGSWSSDVTIPATKGITLQGMGAGATVIATGNKLWVDTSPTNAPVRIMGITFQRTGMGMRIHMLGTATDWRIDHNTFDDAGFSGAYTIEVGVKGNENLDSYNYGVIDHNAFINRNNGTSVHVSWVRWGNVQYDQVASGDRVWSQPAERGSQRMVYIEDNTFSGSPGGAASQVVDTQYGGQVVVRYNMVHNPWISTHSGCTNNGRNTPWVEIYRNTFTEDGDRYSGNAVELRSTSGVVWGNSSATDLVNFNIGVDHERSWRTDCGGAYGGQADGTRAFDENLGPHGHRALGQPGWGPPQNGNMNEATFAGVFAWENLNNGVLSDLFIANNFGYSSEHMQFGRELFNAADVTVGPLAARPLTCTVGPPRSVFISTDENTQGPVVHVASAANVWSRQWEPFCYPHPLVSGVPCDLSTNVAGSRPDDNIRAVPNPFSEELELKGVLPTETLRILSVTGGVLFEGRAQHLDAGRLIPGVHLVQVRGTILRIVKL